ncbi:hypothetical protein RN346_05190 [Halomonas sp. PAMB 3232]|uniref:hypothetical protein n=1 Tax=Halomonas sp. PAMB 3232 TaxID=3075221 RepID=UPI0028A02608|nr:hypothetical protein [Halomonas sp. PAMB 3232]WNL39958.1 hypothetical protein RN346_05190 [Halomonas sp. PAMB 3232]
MLPKTTLLPRWLLLALSIVLILAIILSMAWWLVNSLLLNSQWMANRLSKIDGVEVRWERAHSQHPGRWEVDQLTLTRQDTALPVSISVERATLSLSLPALLRGTLHIQALEADGIRRFRVGDIALNAEGNLRLEDATFSGDTLSAARLMLAVEQGRLVRASDGAILARDIALDAQGTLAPLLTRQPSDVSLTPALLEALSARVDASARADAWDVFMPYLDALPWLSLAGRGALEVALAMEKGTLSEASEVTLRAPQLELGVDTAALSSAPQPVGLSRHTATGSGQVRLHVSDNALHFAAALEDVVLADATPYAEQAALSMSAAVPNQRLDRLAPPSGAELELDGRVTRLDMLDRYLRPSTPGALALSGQGRLGLRVSVRQSELYRGRLDIQAQNLGAAYDDFTAQGDGTLSAEREPGAPLDAHLALKDASLTHQNRTLLADGDITLDLESPIEQPSIENVTARLGWQNATLPSIAALTPYLNAALPTPGALELVSGRARSQGQLSLDAGQLDGELTLSGERWVTRLQSERQPQTLESDARLMLNVRRATLDGSAFDLGGSSLRWQVASREARAERLESVLVLRQGRFRRQNGVLSGELSLEGEVQRLGFLNTFLPEGPGLSVAGSGELFLDAVFTGSELLPPTRLRVNANDLEARFLDFAASGRGELHGELSSRDDASLTLSIPRFALTRAGDDRPALAGRHLALTTQTARFRQAREAPSPEYFTTRVELPVIEVADITRYNDYLPDTDGVTLLGGQASLESEWRLEGYRVEGETTLRAFQTELSLLEQRLRGDIELHLALTEGDWQTRRFRADDSWIQLENVFRLSGEGRQDAGWWVRLELIDAALTMDEPVELTSTLRLGMRDTGLLARLFLARARDNDWLGRLLNVHGIEGSAELSMSGERIALNDLTLSGGSLWLLSDITLEKQRVNGALYARLGVLGLGVELVDGEPSLRLLQPKRWFDRWRQAQRYPRP